MACSSANSNNDLYRDSFKYFKNCVHSASPQLSPHSNRKPKCKGLPGAVQTQNGNVGEPFLRNGNNGEGERESEKNEVEFNDILLRHPHQEEGDNLKDIIRREVFYTSGCKCYQMWGLRSPETWTVAELTFPSGLIVIRNPFTPLGQRYWMSRTLLDFPHHPDYITNMDNLNRLEKQKKGDPVDNLEDFKLDTCGRNFYEKLRWVTFGYHHDWDTKVYTEERRSNFPEDLADMTRYISQILGFRDFEAEAAIANYYHMDSTLSGHVDRSEVNQYAPLFSLSFGQTAIFLIGGKTKCERPQPVLLQSGDIAIMSGESRLSYHGVPKILPAGWKSWDEENASIIQDRKVDLVQDEDKVNSCKRQKMDDNLNQNSDVSVPAVSCVHDCPSFSTSLRDPEVHSRMGSMSWTKFVEDYINKSRINLNIRQVLFPGQSDLYSETQK